MPDAVDMREQIRKVYAQTEAHRAMCEAIWVSKTLKGDVREQFFQRVGKRRGPSALLKLRLDVSDLESAR